MQQLRNALRRAPYAGLIVLATFAALIVVLQEGQNGVLRPLSAFGFQVLTGVMLVGGMSFQWILFVRRVTGNGRNGRFWLASHRWTGAGMTVLFGLHAIRFGHLWMTVLSVAFFLLALSGVLSRDVLRYRQNWIYLIWLAVHIGLSAALVPLVALHIWVALAYQ